LYRRVLVYCERLAMSCVILGARSICIYLIHMIVGKCVFFRCARFIATQQLTRRPLFHTFEEMRCTVYTKCTEVYSYC
jgi:hypothetical protein